MSQGIYYTVAKTIASISYNPEVETYAEILDRHFISYRVAEGYLHVGELSKIQGWILHISAVRWQIALLIEAILPTLVAAKVAFKIPENREMARNILDGNLGCAQLGKIISLYPETDDLAQGLVKELVQLTGPFKGPQIPTDAWLGGTLYARYGAFTGVLARDSDGRQIKCIYNSQGQLTPDTLDIPFRLTTGIDWPFTSTAISGYPTAGGILKGKYKAIATLKSDAKGDVLKGVYLRKWMIPGVCVIKQGKKFMWSDEWDRDMIDRLMWQMQVHNRLGNLVPLPKVIDFFIEGAVGNLILEYIDGPNLLEKVFLINKYCECWQSLQIQDRETVINYLIQVIEILEAIHRIGLVHRDFTPVNFLVARHDKLFLIDNELVFDLKAESSRPAYEGGTPGFMSPQQMNMQTPIEQDDIYAVGALMIAIFTGHSPSQLNSNNIEKLCQFLRLVLGEQKLVGLVQDCLQQEPEKRPTIKYIRNVLAMPTNWNTNTDKKVQNKSLSKVELDITIRKGMRGMVNAPTTFQNGLWYSRSSKSTDLSASDSIEFVKSTGFFEGIAGILYFLAKMHRSGYEINDCRESFDKGWQFIKNRYLDPVAFMPSGLYGGRAGIALSLFHSIKSSLLPATEENKALISNCLSGENDHLDFAFGIAGQGYALLQCREFLSEGMVRELIDVFVSRLIDKSDSKGNWIYIKEHRLSKYNATSFSYGNTGILYFLLESLRCYDSANLVSLVNLALDASIVSAKQLEKRGKEKGCRNLLNEDPQYMDGLQGLVLVFLKAYLIFKEQRFKHMAERLLRLYPSKLSHPNLFQHTGLSGIGELYLEAYRISHDKEWYDRASWIANYLVICSQEGNSQSLYWIGNKSEFSTADLMTGNSGIIHFLANFSQTGDFGYRLLY